MELSITLEQPQKAGELFGPADKHRRMIRESMGVQIFAREGQVRLTGGAQNVSRAAGVLQQLQRALREMADHGLASCDDYKTFLMEFSLKSFIAVRVGCCRGIRYFNP